MVEGIEDAQADTAGTPDEAAVVFGVCVGVFRASPGSCEAAGCSPDRSLGRSTSR